MKKKRKTPLNVNKFYTSWDNGTFLLFLKNKKLVNRHKLVKQKINYGL